MFLKSQWFSLPTLEVTLNIVVVCVLHHGVNYTEASKEVKAKHLRKNTQSSERVPPPKGNNVCESISSAVKYAINVRMYYSALLEENQLSHSANSYRTDFLITPFSS